LRRFFVTKIPTFDPRHVPVAAIDGHLPALGPSTLEPGALAKRFMQSPTWTPEIVSEPRFSNRSPVHASVLIPLVLHERVTVLLTKRTQHLSSHSGQIAFPGGKADPGDSGTIATALREAHEEIGLDAAWVDVLGTLPIYATGSGFLVTPVVALVREGFSISANAFEVAEVFEVPLDFLMNPANHRRHFVQWNGAQHEWLSIPYMDGNVERFVWGVTAAILRNLYRFLAI
jgi:8-oxo-dGTP pyrophosphatase MutT (NUDIX family)